MQEEELQEAQGRVLLTQGALESCAKVHRDAMPWCCCHRVCIIVPSPHPGTCTGAIPTLARWTWGIPAQAWPALMLLGMLMAPKTQLALGKAKPGFKETGP